MTDLRGGYDKLWGWFCCSRASFLTLPRVLMHEMPDEWQGRMAALLDEFNDAFPSAEIETRVQKVKNRKLVKWPEWMLNYRHPDRAEIARAKEPLKF